MDGTEEHHLKQVKKAKIICSPSYADYRPKTNAVIYWAWVTLRGECSWEE
jgi:hypothetical protein